MVNEFVIWPAKSGPHQTSAWLGTAPSGAADVPFRLTPTIAEFLLSEWNIPTIARFLLSETEHSASHD